VKDDTVYITYLTFVVIQQIPKGLYYFCYIAA